MTDLLNAGFTGIAVGSVYGLVALAYSVVFVATRVFNLAQGALVMVGVLLSYFALKVQGWPQAAAFALVVVGVVGVSLFEERLIVRPFLRRSPHNIGWFIATLAFSLVLETIATILYGDNPPNPVPSPLGSTPVHVGPITTTPQLLLSIGALLVITLAIELLYRRTWIGHALRATAEDREIAALRGISPTRMSRLAFLIGGLISAISAFVVAPVVYADVTIGLNYSVKGFVALAIGGFGSIRGALVGALCLGITEQVFDLYGDARYEMVAGFGLLLLVLLIRPNGILGDRQARTV
jgi:branched-subunit amino acid ABC-type transport system permease component